MARGKFEKSRAVPASKPEHAKKKKSRKGLWIALAASAAAIVLVGVGLLVLRPERQKKPTHLYLAGVDIAGMGKEEALAAVQEAVSVYEKENMTVLLYSEPEKETIKVTYEPEEPEATEEGGAPTQEATEPATTEPAESETTEPTEPEDPDFPGMAVDSTLCLQAADVHVQVDAEKAVEDALKIRGEGTHTVALTQYMTLNEDYIHEFLNSYLAETATELKQPEVKQGAQKQVTNTVDGKEETHSVETVDITLGQRGRTLDATVLYNKILDAYYNMEFTVKDAFQDEYPAPVDVDAIYAKYCKEAVPAAYDEKTFTVTEEVNGYGFDKKTVVGQLEAAQPGETVTVELDTIVPEMTKAYLESKLFADVLGKYDTWHSKGENRTNNLILACKAINGRVFLPGEVFSFNGVVGQRTAAKGYKPATVYVGNDSADQLGGGICQVASTIYCAALYADMGIVERTEHNFFAGYTPGGMDATVYYGSLDFKFKNTSEFPIKIEAWVSGGQVHIRIIGTKTKNYTVKMECVKNSEDPYEKVEHIIKDGESYSPGQVIVSGYTGSTWTTYRVYVDANGNVISRNWEANSRYRRRDEITAVEDPNKVQPTEPPTEPPTEAPTEPPTEAPTEPPTEPPTEATTESNLPRWDWSMSQT